MQNKLFYFLILGALFFQFNVANGQLIINEIHADPANGLAGDTNNDGTRDTSQDEFIEIFNNGNNPVNLSGWRIRDNANANRHQFPNGTVIPSGGTIVVFGGGNPQGLFNGSLIQTASSGALGLNNNGDRVSLLNSSGNTITSYQYSGSQGGDNQSITRSPDVTGSFTKHLSLGGLRYSPGSRTNGSAFSGNTNSSCNSIVSNFPYQESFEGNFGSWTQVSTDDIDFTRRSGSTPSSGTGPSSANNGSTYIYVEASGNGTGFPNKTAQLISPCFDFSSIPNPSINFDYHMFGSNVNNLLLEISSDGGINWTQLFSRSGDQGNSWFTQQVNLETFSSSTVSFRFTVTTGTGNTGWRSDVALDHIQVKSGGNASNNDPLQVVTWNVEWFGNSSNGPSPESTQLTRVQNIIETLDADVYALQEISNENLMDQLVAQLPEYEWVFSTFVSGGNNTPEVTQKLAFIYKTSRVSNVQNEALLTNFHPIYNGGNEGLIADYPTGSPSQFWASGRMPFQLRADVNIGNTTERVYFINIHAKASGGNTNRSRRQYDGEILKEYIDGPLANSNVILLGDYNDQMDSNDSPYFNYFNDNASNPGNDGEYYNVLTRQLDIDGVGTFVNSSSFLDHISITDELSDNYISGSITVHDEVVTSDFTSVTSDHIPVSAKFSFGNSTSARTASSKATSNPNFLTKADEIRAVIIYPNPAKEIIHIDLQESVSQSSPTMLSIYDLKGSLLKEMQLDKGENLISLTSLKSDDVYLFKIQTANDVFIRKVVLSK